MLFEVEIRLHGMNAANTVSLIGALEDAGVVGHDQPEVGSSSISPRVR